MFVLSRDCTLTNKATRYCAPVFHCVPGEATFSSSRRPTTSVVFNLNRSNSQAISCAAAFNCTSPGGVAVKLPASATAIPSALAGAWPVWVTAVSRGCIQWIEPSSLTRKW